MTDMTEGWTFTDSTSIDWTPIGEGIAMKALGEAEGRVIMQFQFAPGYVGGVHQHHDAEFTYILEGEMISNGVTMKAGHAYAVGAGTTHEEFRTDVGATVLSVFPKPAGM